MGGEYPGLVRNSRGPSAGQYFDQVNEGARGQCLAFKGLDELVLSVTNVVLTSWCFGELTDGFHQAI